MPHVIFFQKRGRNGIQSSNHPIIQSSNHPIIQSSNHPIIQSSNHPIIQLSKQSSNQAIKQSSNQAIKQSSNQAIKQRYPIVITFTKIRLKIFYSLSFPLSLTNTAIFLKNLIP
ncbi:hypothetical protein KVE65_04585 [Helicobacter pylori]|nr:hypothetical protein KVE65_04585 [Helicobacter pylori]